MATQSTKQQVDLTRLIPTVLEKFYCGISEEFLRKHLFEEMRVSFSLAEFATALNSCLTTGSIRLHFEIDAEPIILVPLLFKKLKNIT